MIPFPNSWNCSWAQCKWIWSFMQIYPLSLTYLGVLSWHCCSCAQQKCQRWYFIGVTASTVSTFRVLCLWNFLPSLISNRWSLLTFWTHCIAGLFSLGCKEKSHFGAAFLFFSGGGETPVFVVQSIMLSVSRELLYLLRYKMRSLPPNGHGEKATHLIITYKEITKYIVYH